MTDAGGASRRRQRLKKRSGPFSTSRASAHSQSAIQRAGGVNHALAGWLTACLLMLVFSNPGTPITLMNVSLYSASALVISCLFLWLFPRQRGTNILGFLLIHTILGFLSLMVALGIPL